MSRWDWIVRAGVPHEVLERLRPRGLSRIVAELSGAGRALAALDGTLGWQTARLDYLELLVAALAGGSQRAWLGRAERPLFLTGSGGGGTRILGEAAARLGVNLGARVNESWDSVEWAPPIYGTVLGDDVDLLEHARATHARWLRSETRWGVKLPELVLTLPAVLETFPTAQVVLLTRHPIGAAFRRAHLTSLPDHPIGAHVLTAAYREAGRDPAAIARDPQWRRNALTWRYQIGGAWARLDALGPERFLHLRVEDFATDSGATERALAAFVGLPPARAHLAVDRERLALTRDRRAREVMGLCGALAHDLGYR